MIFECVFVIATLVGSLVVFQQISSGFPDINAELQIRPPFREIHMALSNCIG